MQQKTTTHVSHPLDKSVLEEWKKKKSKTIY